MTRETSEHGWPVPESGDETWAETISTAIDRLDRAVPVDPPDPPSPGTEGRLVVDRFDRDGTVVLKYDTGDELRVIKAAQRWDVHLPVWSTRDLKISGEWEFEQSVTADITGNAKQADTADSAGFAFNASRLADRPLDDYAVTERDLTVTGAWAFENSPVLDRGLSLTGNTLSLPQYDEPYLEPDDEEEPDLEPEPDPEAVEIETRDVTDITDTSVTLQGEVLTMGGYDSFYAFFEFDTYENWELEGGDFTNCGPSQELTEAGEFEVEYPADDSYGDDVFTPGERIVWRAGIATDPCSSGWRGDRDTFEMAPGSSNETSTDAAEATSTTTTADEPSPDLASPASEPRSDRHE